MRNGWQSFMKICVNCVARISSNRFINISFLIYSCIKSAWEKHPTHQWHHQLMNLAEEQIWNEGKFQFSDKIQYLQITWNELIIIQTASHTYINTFLTSNLLYLHCYRLHSFWCLFWDLPSWAILSPNLPEEITR